MINDESGLRKTVKKALKEVGHLSWVESHATSAGIPDLNYCIQGYEGWVELKSGNFEVKASQVIWMEERISNGGHPLFLIEMDDAFFFVCGSQASNLRKNNSVDNVASLAFFALFGGLNPDVLISILKERGHRHGEWRR